jgi:putative restriction endonuclease
MNPLQRTLIEKAGHDNGFEHVFSSDNRLVVLASARYPAQVQVTALGQGFEVRIQNASVTLAQEMARNFAYKAEAEQIFVLQNEAALARWLRRAATLSQALPNQAVIAFEQQVQAELSSMALPVVQNTEVLRMVRQRVGQQAYRQAMLQYWGGACAVTGLVLPQALRASHAKPWAECITDAERLDVYNGFLLNANLDALFDNFLISFTDDGKVLISREISQSDRECLGLNSSMRLRWIAASHFEYLEFHRQKFVLLGALNFESRSI